MSGARQPDCSQDLGTCTEPSRGARGAPSQQPRCVDSAGWTAQPIVASPAVSDRAPSPVRWGAVGSHAPGACVVFGPLWICLQGLSSENSSRFRALPRLVSAACRCRAKACSISSRGLVLGQLRTRSMASRWAVCSPSDRPWRHMRETIQVWVRRESGARSRRVGDRSQSSGGTHPVGRLLGAVRRPRVCLAEVHRRSRGTGTAARPFRSLSWGSWLPNPIIGIAERIIRVVG
jgi:hypothetical protein